MSDSPGFSLREAVSSSIQPSLASELNSRVIEALDRAGKLPAGDKRTDAMRRAAILGNAAEILAYFSVSKAPRQNDDAAILPGA